MSKLNTHSPIYCMKYNWENLLNLRHTRDRMYLTSILELQYFKIRLHNDHSEVVQYENKQIEPSDYNVLHYLRTSLDCTVIKETKPSFPDMKPTAYDGKNHLKHTRTEKIWKKGNGRYFRLDDDTRWVTNISSRSSKPKWTSLTHTTPYIATKIRKVTERTKYIWYTLTMEYNQQAFTHASRMFHHMCSMKVSKSA